MHDKTKGGEVARALIAANARLARWPPSPSGSKPALEGGVLMGRVALG
jgi:hypothetical protein